MSAERRQCLSSDLHTLPTLLHLLFGHLLCSWQTSMSSKIIGTDAEFFASMVVDAVSAVRRDTADGKGKYPLSAINVVKSHGRSAHEVS